MIELWVKDSFGVASVLKGKFKTMELAKAFFKSYATQVAQCESKYIEVIEEGAKNE
jgi:hypothetical protein